MLRKMFILLLLLTSLDGSAASIEDSQAPASAPVPVYAAPIDEKANDKATCAEKWDRYQKSEECFGPYHNVDGTMKPGAFEHCTDIKQPTECPR
jgi:hypothetical protein